MTSSRARFSCYAPFEGPEERFNASTGIVRMPLVRCARSEEHTSELQSQSNLVCRLLLEKKKKKNKIDSRETHNTKTESARQPSMSEPPSTVSYILHQSQTCQKHAGITDARSEHRHDVIL